MKTAIRASTRSGVAACIFLAAIALFAAACGNPAGDRGQTGTITISLGAGTARAALPWPPEDETGNGILVKLRYEITIYRSGNPNDKITLTVNPGVGIASQSVPVGTWYVKVDAFYVETDPGTYYATGVSDPVEVQKGKISTATVKMSQAGFQAVKGKLTVTGLGSHNGKYVYVSGTAGAVELLGVEDMAFTGGVTTIYGQSVPDFSMTLTPIAGGQAVVPLYAINDNATDSTNFSDYCIAYDGNDAVDVIKIYIFDVSPLNTSNIVSAMLTAGKNGLDMTLEDGTFATGYLDCDWVGTPIAADFIFGNMIQTENIVSDVIISPKTGASPGAITIYYDGIQITPPPQAAGTYAVTFDVAAIKGWNAATDLRADNLVVNDLQTPALAHYTVTGSFTQTLGSVTAITVTPVGGYSTGAVTVKYGGNTALPTVRGSHAVTFDVAAAAGWNGTTLTAVTPLVVNQNPVAADHYTFGNLTQTAGRVTAVTITPNGTGSPGARTIYYEGISPTIYTRSTSRPQAAGTYAVTFDVAADAANYWNAATGLSAGNLVVIPPGTSWTAVENSTFGTGTSDYIYAIAYGNGVFVAGGMGGNMAYSYNRVKWTAVTDSTLGTSTI
jgi:hypothetical protein